MKQCMAVRDERRAVTLSVGAFLRKNSSQAPHRHIECFLEVVRIAEVHFVTAAGSPLLETRPLRWSRIFREHQTAYYCINRAARLIHFSPICVCGCSL